MIALLVGLASAQDATVSGGPFPETTPVLQLEFEETRTASPASSVWVFTVPADAHTGDLFAASALTNNTPMVYTVVEPDPSSPGNTRPVRTIELTPVLFRGFTLDATRGSGPTLRLGVSPGARRICTYTWPAGTPTCDSWSYVRNLAEYP